MLTTPRQLDAQDALTVWGRFLDRLGVLDGELASDLRCDPPQFIKWLLEQSA